MKYFTWLNGRQESCNYKKMCIWSFKRFKFAFDFYILKYEANTALPWHLDKVEDGTHWRLNIKLKGRAYFFIRNVSRKLIHDKIILFRPDIQEHQLIIITPTIKLSFGFAKFK